MTDKSVQLHFLVNPTPILISDPEFDFTSHKQELVEDYPYIYAKLDLPNFTITDPVLVSKYINPRSTKFFISGIDLRTNILLHDYFNLTVSPEVRRLIDLGRFGIPEFFQLKPSKQQKIINGLLRRTPQILPEEAVRELIRRGIIQFYDYDHKRIYLSSNVCEFPIGFSLLNIISNPDLPHIMRKSEYNFYLTKNYALDYLGSRAEVERLCQKCGMIIPPHAVDYIDYYMENYEFYKNVKSDSSEMINMPDERIFRNLGVYYFYWNRQDLLRKADKIMDEITSNDDLIAFLPLGDYFIENAINKTLPGSFDDPLEVLKLHEAYCVGNFFSFILLSKNEIVDTLERTDFPEFILPQFNPEDMPGYTPIFDMNDQIMSKLLILLAMYPRDNRIDSLSKSIIRKIDIRSKIGVFYYNLKKKYDRLSIDSKSQIKEWLQILFELGMYFRRWDGKGAYPLSEWSTKIRGPEYAEEMGQKYLEIISKAFANYSPEAQAFIQELPMFDHHNYNTTIDICDQDKSIYNFVIDTVYKKSAYCIRMASSYLIATSYIIQLKILDENIPNFYIFNMDHIA